MPNGKKPKVEIFNDNFQNFKKYGIPKAQLVIADIPYNIGADAYGSNPMWYNGGDGRITITGVRWAESVNRKHNQGLISGRYT